MANSKHPVVPQLSPRQFRVLQAIFEQISGLSFDENSQALFHRRLLPRLEAHKFDSFAHYCQLIERGHRALAPEGLLEINEALELLTIGETYFFRHDEQMALLQREVLPALAKANSSKRDLAIWSAGCSSGEELYSLAILIRESGLFEGWNVTLMGGDLSRQRIAQARSGSYPESAFRTTSNARRTRFFDKDKSSWKVKSDLHDSCQFHVVNLLSPDSFTWIGRVHLVLCRNVLIYLSPSARTEVLKHLHSRLNPGGYLLLGHSESLFNTKIPGELKALGHDMAYQRPQLARGGANSLRAASIEEKS